MFQYMEIQKSPWFKYGDLRDSDFQEGAEVGPWKLQTGIPHKCVLQAEGDYCEGQDDEAPGEEGPDKQLTARIHGREVVYD